MIRLTTAAALLVLGTAAATASDLPSKKSPPSVPAIMSYNWTGMYLGATVGGAWSGVKAVPFDVPSAYGRGTLRAANLAFGATVGDNYQLPNNIVVGAEADISFANLGKSGGFDEDDALNNPWSTKTRSYGTIRARLGYAMDRFMPYITGGLAWQDSKLYWNYENTPAYYRPRALGWAAGFGGEYALSDNITLKAEYLHLDFGGKTNSNIQFSDDRLLGGKFKSSQDIARIGVNFKFGETTPAVVAKY